MSQYGNGRKLTNGEEASQRHPSAEHDDAVPLPERDGAQPRRRDELGQRGLAVDGSKYVERGVLTLRVRIRCSTLLLVLLCGVADAVDAPLIHSRERHELVVGRGDGRVRGCGEAELVVHPEPAARRDALARQPEALDSLRRARVALVSVGPQPAAVEDGVGIEVGGHPRLVPCRGGVAR
eukprot:4436688-Prymnesium_polylepis.2